MSKLIRDMTLADLEEVAAIEQDNPNPWNVDLFKDSIERKLSCRLVEVNGLVASYMITDLQGDTAYPVNLSTCKDFRRQGLGELLFKDLLNYCSDVGAKRLKIHISKTNIPALRFNHKKGYKKVGVHKNYYGNEDAIICVKEL